MNASTIKSLMAYAVLLPSIAFGEVVVQELNGVSGSLPGPDYVVEAEYGITRGENHLFGFDRFNISSNESVTIYAPETSTNVLARIGDVSPSSIDGLVSLKNSQANLWLINSSGLLIGQHARFDIPAALHLSTSGALRMEDGSVSAIYDDAAYLALANSPANSVSSAGGQIILDNASLIQNGNLSLTASLVSLYESHLDITDGGLTIAGNDIAMVNTTINANGSLDIQGENIQLDQVSLTQSMAGSVSNELTASSQLNITNSHVKIESSGNVETVLWQTTAGGSLSIHDSAIELSSRNTSQLQYDLKAPHIDITDSAIDYTATESAAIHSSVAADRIRMANTILRADSRGGAGGEIALSSDDLYLLGNGEISLFNRLDGMPFGVNSLANRFMYVEGEYKLNTVNDNADSAITGGNIELQAEAAFYKTPLVQNSLSVNSSGLGHIGLAPATSFDTVSDANVPAAPAPVDNGPVAEVPIQIVEPEPSPGEVTTNANPTNGETATARVADQQNNPREQTEIIARELEIEPSLAQANILHNEQPLNPDTSTREEKVQCQTGRYRLRLLALGNASPDGYLHADDSGITPVARAIRCLN